MDCIVSIHYKDSGFELEQCDFHRRKRHAGDHEKELGYKIELLVEEPITTTTASQTIDDTMMTPGDKNMNGGSAEILTCSTIGLLLLANAI